MTSTDKTVTLVSELRGLSAYPGDAYDRAADALESNSCALNEKEAELASLGERFAHLLAVKDAHAEKRFEATERAETAERERDAALAALKASEEREAATIEAGRDLLSYLALFDFNDRDPGEELPEHMARLTAALFARSALENRPSTLADATNPAAGQREAGV